MMPGLTRLDARARVRGLRQLLSRYASRPTACPPWPWRPPRTGPIPPLSLSPSFSHHLNPQRLRLRACVPATTMRATPRHALLCWLPLLCHPSIPKAPGCQIHARSSLLEKSSLAVYLLLGRVLKRISFLWGTLRNIGPSCCRIRIKREPGACTSTTRDSDPNSCFGLICHCSFRHAQNIQGYYSNVHLHISSFFFSSYLQTFLFHPTLYSSHHVDQFSHIVKCTR
jgi:hypothetical protein